MTDALGGGPEIESLLSTNGWQAGMSKTFESTDPATTGSTQIVVSAHAFKDDASAQAMLPEFDGILQNFGWTSVPMDPVGDGSAMLTWTDAETGNTAVTVYFVDGQVVYRVAVYDLRFRFHRKCDVRRQSDSRPVAHVLTARTSSEFCCLFSAE